MRKTETIVEHTGTLAEYLHAREFITWLPEHSAHVLEHIRQVEAVWKQLYEARHGANS